MPDLESTAHFMYSQEMPASKETMQLGKFSIERFEMEEKMNTATELRTKLRNIDHRGYPAYKELKG
ncbi:MAG: ABC-ATPase domain-containing protein, partial [Lachnospiraceae bacterium]|nr:ABC-ATPase domain-containing protein [Lachnospiraceae bacterium]